MPNAPQRKIRHRIRMADWAHLKSEFTWAYEGKVRSPFDDIREHHPGQSALLIREGSLYVECADGSMEATAGQWMFPRQGPRRQRFSKGTTILSVHFHLNWAGGSPLFDWPVAWVLEGAAYPLLERKARHLIQKVDRQMPGVSIGLPWEEVDIETYFRIQPSFDTWLCTYVESLTHAGCEPTQLAGIDPRVLKAVNVLDDLRLSESMTEGELASKVGLGTAQLTRLFTNHFTLTPRQYLERRRITRARQLLDSAPLSIKQIAYELGFSSLPSFSRWFRQKTHLSARDYRKQGGR